MSESRFEIVIQSAVDEDFTTAELEFPVELDGKTVVASVRVYELPDGWRIELPSLVGADFTFHLDDFLESVERGRKALQRYINRTGQERPSGLTASGKALWGMLKDDGTAMGKERKLPAESPEPEPEGDSE